jgi:hypothetical protein
MLSNTAVGMAINCFAMRVCSVAALEAWATQFEKFSGEGQSFVAIFDQLNNALTWKMSQASVDEKISFPRRERIDDIISEKRERGCILITTGK